MPLHENSHNSPEPLTKYHLVIFQHGRRDRINRPFVALVQTLLDEIITTPPEFTEIDIWLESPGGDSHAAYKLILDLRSRCKKLCAVIPDYAKSAATLVALGMDCIYMSPAAELGPLDVQMEHPDREGVEISALDVANSLEYLTDTALDLTITGGLKVLKYTQLPRHEVLHEILQFMARFLKPTITKLDPHIIHRANNELKVAEQYAKRMLKMRKLPENRQMDEEASSNLLSKLIKDYPTHGFVISRTEAKQLDLPIEDAETNYNRWQRVKSLYEFSYQEGQTIVTVLLDSDLDIITEVADLIQSPEINETTVVENEPTENVEAKTVEEEQSEERTYETRQEGEAGTN